MPDSIASVAHAVTDAERELRYATRYLDRCLNPEEGALVTDVAVTDGCAAGGSPSPMFAIM